LARAAADTACSASAGAVTAALQSAGVNLDLGKAPAAAVVAAATRDEEATVALTEAFALLLREWAPTRNAQTASATSSQPDRRCALLLELLAVLDPQLRAAAHMKLLLHPGGATAATTPVLWHLAASASVPLLRRRQVAASLLACAGTLLVLAGRGVWEDAGIYTK
jgi:hypothetical protein